MTIPLRRGTMGAEGVKMENAIIPVRQICLRNVVQLGCFYSLHSR